MPTCAVPTCLVCGKTFAIDELTPAPAVLPPIAKLIAHEHRRWNPEAWICAPDLTRFRMEHLKLDVAGGFGVMSDLESDVLRSVREDQVVAEDLNRRLDKQATFSTRIYHAVSQASGVTAFASLLLVCAGLWYLPPEAASAGGARRFHGILLALAGLGALQAPVILAGLRHREERDRLGAENDYKRSLRTEIAGRQLEAKLDHLLVLHTRGTRGSVPHAHDDVHVHDDAPGENGDPREPVDDAGGPQRHRNRTFMPEADEEEESSPASSSAPKRLKLVP